VAVIVRVERHSLSECLDVRIELEVGLVFGTFGSMGCYSFD
jgi:hypothetical protein